MDLLNQVEPELIMSLGAGLSLLIQFLKTKVFPEVDPRYINAGISVILAAALLIAKGAIGDDYLVKLSGLATTFFGLATAIYKLAKKG